MTRPDGWEPFQTVETRYVTADGRTTEFDLHNGPCDCRREQRTVYTGPWLAAGGRAGGGTAPDLGAGCTLPMPSREDLERRAAEDAAPPTIAVTFPSDFSDEQVDLWRRAWHQANPIHVLWSELRTSRAGGPNARADTPTTREGDDDD